MTLLDTIFENNARAAHAVSTLVGESTPHPRRFTTRPFNRFDTAFTEWWMIPSSDWPAYKHGKLCFWRYPNDSDGLMYVGYYVEKGLHPDVSDLPEVDPNQILQQDWYWPAFANEVESGRISQVANRIAKAAGAYPSILIHAHEFNKVPKEDQPRAHPSDAVVFRLGSDGGGIELVQAASSTLADVNASKSIESVLESLSKLDLRFHWIDFIVGLAFRYGISSVLSWNAERLWQDALQPWLPWVR